MQPCLQTFFQWNDTTWFKSTENTERWNWKINNVNNIYSLILPCHNNYRSPYHWKCYQTIFQFLAARRPWAKIPDCLHINYAVYEFGEVVWAQWCSFVTKKNSVQKYFIELYCTLYVRSLGSITILGRLFWLSDLNFTMSTLTLCWDGGERKIRPARTNCAIHPQHLTKHGSRNDWLNCM